MYIYLFRLVLMSGYGMTRLGKSFSFDLPCMSFVNFWHFFPLCFEIEIWDLILLLPDHYVLPDDDFGGA